MTTPTGSTSGISAVIFDLDGVLIESEERWDETRQGLASDAGRRWPAEATRAMQGMSTPEWSAYLADTVGIPGSPEQLADTVISRMAAGYSHELPLLPDAVDVVARLAARWPLGLASSSPPRLIDAVLSAAGIAGLFQVTRSSEQVAAGKPSPDVYLEVVARLGVPAGRTVAIEDSSNGIRSAAAAGLIVLAIPHAAFPPAADALTLAAMQVTRLADVTTDLIAALAPEWS